MITITLTKQQYSHLSQQIIPYITFEINQHKIEIQDTLYTTPVPNVLRYQIKKCDDKVFNILYLKCHKVIGLIPSIGESIDEFNSKLPAIVLILESPHTHEFASGDITKPIAPAMGKTGIKINNHLINLINKLNLLKNKKYNFYIINPVPFQASLGLNLHNDSKNQRIRDSVWMALWSAKQLGLEKKFIKLLKEIPANSIILNGCTGGKKGMLKSTIRECIEQINFINSNIYIGEISHPSSPSYQKSIEKLSDNLKKAK